MNRFGRSYGLAIKNDEGAISDGCRSETPGIDVRFWILSDLENWAFVVLVDLVFIPEVFTSINQLFSIYKNSI